MTTRALVVGLGAIGQRHARNLRTLLGEDLVLSALRSRHDGVVVTDTLAIEPGSPEADCDGGVFTDVSDALAARPDVVLVCNPTSLHLQMAVASVEAGASVFIEKPLSDDLDGIDQLRATADRHGAVVAVGCQLRFHPTLLRLRDLLDKDAVGRLITVQVEEGEYLPGWHPYEDYHRSYAARRDLGGGVVLTQIHELDYVHWLFGLPQRVFAVGGTLGGLGIEVEDTASALFEHEVAGGRLPVHVHLDYLQQPPRRTCRVVGEAGAIDIDLRRPELTWCDNAGTVLEHDEFAGYERSQLFLEELASFLDCARTGSAPEVGLAHAAHTLRLALAVRRSIEMGTLETVTGENQ